MPRSGADSGQNSSIPLRRLIFSFDSSTVLLHVRTEPRPALESEARERSGAQSGLVGDVSISRMETVDERVPRPLTAEFARTPPSAERRRVDHDCSPSLTPPRRNRPKLHRVSLVVLVVGLVVTGVLTASSRLSYLHDEQRLSNLQTNLTASALGIAPVDLERRLGQAAAAAGEASEPVATFRRVIASSIAPAGPFATATLVLVGRGHVQVLAHVGAQPINSPTGKAATALFERAAKSASLITTRVVGNGQQRFGYLMSFVGPGGTYVASAGQDLPSSRRLVIPSKFA